MTDLTTQTLIISTEKGDITCKQCQKKVVKKVTCNNCNDVFHPACLKQARDQKKAGCKHEAKDTNQKDTILTEEDFLREENKLLRQILQDKDIIINDKEAIITLQNEKIAILEDRLKKISLENVSPYTYPSINKYDNVQQTKDIISDKLDGKETGNKNDIIDSSSITNEIKEVATRSTTNIQGKPKISPKEVNAEIIQIQTKQKFKEVINLTKDNGFEKPKNNSTVSKRRTGRYMKGNGTADKEFYGREQTDKKIWLFLSRVPDTIRAENIAKYIEVRTKSNNLCVKKLTTKSIRPDNQSFMIGVETEFKEQVYRPSFWPMKIIFSRFDFNLGRHLLNDKPQENGIQFEDNSRPKSFL